MPVETKIRKVQAYPAYSVFKPAKVPLRDLTLITITLEEFEAIRLVDFEDKNQREAAEIMEISQPTINRILKSARKKLGQMLVQGHAIVIEGGVIALHCVVYRCKNCGFHWTAKRNEPVDLCEKCRSTEIERISM